MCPGELVQGRDHQHAVAPLPRRGRADRLRGRHPRRTHRPPRPLGSRRGRPVVGGTEHEPQGTPTARPGCGGAHRVAPLPGDPTLTCSRSSDAAGPAGSAGGRSTVSQLAGRQMQHHPPRTTVHTRLGGGGGAGVPPDLNADILGVRWGGRRDVDRRPGRRWRRVNPARAASTPGTASPGGRDGAAGDVPAPIAPAVAGRRRAPGGGGERHPGTGPRIPGRNRGLSVRGATRYIRTRLAGPVPGASPALLSAVDVGAVGDADDAHEHFVVMD